MAESSDPLATLQDVLAAAARIAHDLSTDRLLPRLVEVFARMPIEDRETILQVLEREVDLRTHSKESPHAGLAGLHAARANPNARLYLRMADGESPPYVAPEEIVQAVIRGARMVHRAAGRGRDLRTEWGPAIIDGMARLEPDERDTLRSYHRTMLDLLDGAEASPDGVPPDRDPH